MLFLESYARPLLILHALSAAVLVASTTHHVLWLRGYLRGDFRRYRGERLFASVIACAFLSTFLIGSGLYPTYKVRVRAEYFDNPVAVAAEEALRRAQHLEIDTRPLSPLRSTRPLSAVSRIFDIKEHWVALGCATSLLLLVLSRLAHPKDHPQILALYFGLSAFCCSAAWLGALIGLVTASYRSVGSTT